MRVLNYNEFKLEKNSILDSIKKGNLFIHPTDTIYGIGCNALNADSVNKVREVKARTQIPFSVIAPSVNWIRETCVITDQAEEWLKKLPGPYTFIFKLKSKNVPEEVSPGMDTVGVRMPNHWIKDIVAELSIPIITTSVNKSGEDYMRSLDGLDHSIKACMEFALYEGKKEGRPSTIVHFDNDLKIIER